MPERKRFYVLTGGTLVHVAPHFSLCAPAYGRVGEQIHTQLAATLGDRHDVVLVRTKMALGSQAVSGDERELFAEAGIDRLETNEDLGKLLELLVARADTVGIVLACAVCDWSPSAVSQGGAAELGAAFGKSRPRLDSRGGALELGLRVADKLIGGSGASVRTSSWSGSRRRPGSPRTRSTFAGCGCSRGLLAIWCWPMICTPG